MKKRVVVGSGILSPKALFKGPLWMEELLVVGLIMGSAMLLKLKRFILMLFDMH